MTRWNTRLSKPLADGGATICEKHDFALSNYQDESMAWEVCQALTQAKDDGERMERRIQELGEEANNLEACLDDAEAEIARLKIAHLRRMVGSIRLVLDRHLISAETEAEYERKKWRRNARAGRFAKACLAKITELKEMQCSTKS